MTPAEREARLRAVRRMHDDIYEGIGGQRIYDDEGRERYESERVPPSRDRAIMDARATGKNLASPARESVRDALAEDREEREEMRRKRAKMGGY